MVVIQDVIHVEDKKHDGFRLLDCHGVFGQWALLKWGFTESRNQYAHSTPEIFPGVQR
jgi:hypothetical protein